MAARKTGWAQLKIGLVAIFALAVLAVLIVLMSGANPLFQQSSGIFVYLDDSFAMTPGATPVRLNGTLVGKVSEVKLSGSNELNRAVRVTLSIENESLRDIPVDSTATLATTNLLGGRFVNIKRGKSPQAVQPGAEIQAEPTTAIDDMLEQGKTTLSALQTILQRVENIVIQIEDGKGSIGKFIRDETLYNNLVGVTTNVRELVSAFNNPNSTLGRLINEDGLYEQVQGTIVDVRGTVSRLDQLLDGLNAGEGTLGKLLKDDALHEELRMTIADLRQTLRLVNEGDGTIGKLMTTDVLHRRLEETMTRLDGMLDKINSGEGTIGQLLLNPQLYESMDATMREVQGMMKDFRANPKKFLTIQLKLF